MPANIPPEQVAQMEAARALGIDAGQAGRYVNYSQWALMVSEKLTKYIEEDTDLKVFLPWVDRLTVTSYLSLKEAVLAKLQLKSQIIRRKMMIDEDNLEKFVKMDVLESVIQFLINSDVDGWRGKLAVETRTVASATFEGSPSPRRKWLGIF